MATILTSPLSLAEDWRFPHCPAPGSPLDWAALEQFEWVQALAGVPQSPVHHAEGDVAIHTRMVMEALLGSADYQALAPVERNLLFVATLMHDIAKPVCIQVDAAGEISSPRHAARGRVMARSLLYAGRHGKVPFGIREQIAHLVRHHGLPLWFLEKVDARAAVLRAAETVSMPLLALLAEADVRGRICHDQQELLDRVELFREYCKEQGVWEGPYPFEGGAARFAYFKRPENGPQYVPWDDRRCEVIVLAGLPGAGQDKWVATEGPDWPVISLDEIRVQIGVPSGKNQGPVIAEAKSRAKDFLRKGQSFIWNATNLLPDLRNQLVDLLMDYKARVRMVYVEVPFGQLFRQNKDRGAVVPEEVIHRMMGRWELPESWEGEEVSYWVTE